MAAFPRTRLRRLREREGLRALVREHRVTRDDLVMPLFVIPGQDQRRPIPAMPGQSQLSVDRLVIRARELAEAGLRAVLLFGLPPHKDAQAGAAYDEDSVVCQALRALKRELPELIAMTDVCLCAYTDHGHCGVVREDHLGRARIDNDPSLPLLARMAVAHARAGADVLAPSDMMDGRVAAIREALDQAGFRELPIMSYAAKFASAFYGPFREAAESAPKFGDRRSYQMDPANGEEALREVALDVEEGADIVMVKPGLPYLDLVRRVKERFGLPTAVYNVSGEYSMVKAAAAQGWIDERAVVLETLTAFMRAGADIIISYHSAEAARWLA